MELDIIKESGLLELYALQDLTGEETKIVEDALNTYPELKIELRAIEETLEKLAFLTGKAPSPIVLAELLTEVNYFERMTNGEVPTYPPKLHAKSQIKDFRPWLDRTDLQLPANFQEMSARIIGNSEECTTMILWLQNGAPSEEHSVEIESFLIVEGTCNIIIGEDIHSLTPGDYLTIPLFIKHRIEVTSVVPCKVILERKAA